MLTSRRCKSHACPEQTMHVETKFLRLFRAVELGDDIDGWRVCWVGGWDKCRVLFVVMVKRVRAVPTLDRSDAAPGLRSCGYSLLAAPFVPQTPTSRRKSLARRPRPTDREVAHSRHEEGQRQRNSRADKSTTGNTLEGGNEACGFSVPFAGCTCLWGAKERSWVCG